MRISTSMISHNSITGMLRKQTELAHTSNQMGSGKRILSPSDDPVASAMAFNAKNKLANIEQYGKNIDYARKSMQTTESTLTSIHDRLQRVRQLAIAANSDALGEDGRKTIGLEIKEITGQLHKLMNTRDESGNYIFSGSKVDTEAFKLQNDGSYKYQGDSTERKIQVSDTTFVSPFVSGRSAFDGFGNNNDKNILNELNSFEDALSNFTNGDEDQIATIEGVIDKSNAWLESIADARSVIGTRWNGMDTVKGNNEDLQLFLKENVSNLEDLDYAEATGRFVLEQTALTASQKTFSQISQLSLFNYIR